MDKPYYKASFTTNKKDGGWLLRVETRPGKYPVLPALNVTLKNGDTRLVLIQRRLWTGIDKESGNEIHLFTYIELATFPGGQEKMQWLLNSLLANIYPSTIRNG